MTQCHPHRAEFRFYAELKDFLGGQRGTGRVAYRFSGRPAVKDAVEALGVPHTEVDLLLVNGASVGFGHPLADGDRVAVYPVFEGFDISPLCRLRPRPLRRTRFVLDVHLGKLARILRLLGFDAQYENDAGDRRIIALAAGGQRIILTRDRGLLKHRSVTHGYCVRSADPREQAVEVLRRFDLDGSVRPFSRCPACNGPLAPVEKEAVAHLLPERTRRCITSFTRCASCSKIYWPGSHHRALDALVERLTGRASSSGSKR
jgi:uncharacterized protein with PIN domain